MINNIITYLKNLFGFKKPEPQNFDLVGHIVEEPTVKAEKPVAVKKAKKPRAKKSKN